MDAASADLERLAERQRTGREQVRQVAVMTAVHAAALRPPLFSDAATINKPYDNVALLRMLADIGASRERPVA
jgi:hypothetical protein